MTEDFDDSDYKKPIKVLTPEERDKQYGWDQKKAFKDLLSPAIDRLAKEEGWAENEEAPEWGMSAPEYVKLLAKNNLEEEFSVFLSTKDNVTKEKYRVMWKEEKEKQ